MLPPTAVVPPSTSALASPSPVLQPELPSSAPLLATAPDEAATSRFRAPLTELELNQLAVPFVPVHDRSDVGTLLLRLMALSYVHNLPLVRMANDKNTAAVQVLPLLVTMVKGSYYH